ncbi:unnamed protein product, partial [Effrenium voratum]
PSRTFWGTCFVDAEVPMRRSPARSPRPAWMIQPSWQFCQSARTRRPLLMTIGKRCWRRRFGVWHGSTTSWRGSGALWQGGGKWGSLRIWTMTISGSSLQTRQPPWRHWRSCWRPRGATRHCGGCGICAEIGRRTSSSS